MRMRVLWCLPLVLSAVWWTPSFAGAGEAASAPTMDARAWLERIRHAARERNYQGTMVFTAGDVVSSSRVGHFCVGDQTFERVEALDGRQQSIYRHNDMVHTLWPTRRVATIERRDAVDDAMGLPDLELRLRDQYDVRVLATDRLAGREAHVLMLNPRDNQRFAQRIWADVATGLMLRADTLASNGSVLESVAFSDVEIGLKPQRDSVLAPMKKLDGYRVARLQPVPTRLEAEGWAVANLPTGFKLVGCVKRGIGDPGELVTGSRPSDAIQAVFSDGLARVSVFIEALDPTRQRQPLMTQMGATHTLMRQRHERWWITVMGDVPPMTLKQFLGALERRP
jgi:sigma-E factor negative regulatory protein RseB